MIKTILFDLDGVVVDSEPLYQQAEEQLFAEYGITIPGSGIHYQRTDLRVEFRR